ncbi:alpha/beta fold hydrolase [Algoriphagus halophilus]|uniref:AB hydrolase-1 domain-containing protein n=1 Tax=Algoriphagus halophilus TaxID=226505 RepID=A0A1N6H816_9BACT|nr:alpha/beta fold hydrolase [Algoriphagus halophilus]SIO15903.1 hypothetical protein SAMN05444394_3631 [Algoriphagus halophilus]
MRHIFLFVLLFLFYFSSSGFAQNELILISVNGRQVEVKSSGLEERKLLQPVVIFEAGLGENLSIWDQVFNQVSDFAPVLSYNRAGIGKSEASSETITIASRVEELEGLLKEMKIDPPYLLVGNNWGSLITKDFLVKHPEDVLGTLFLDPIVELDNQQGMADYFEMEGLDGGVISSEYIEFLNSRMRYTESGVQNEVTAFLSLLIENKVTWDSEELPNKQTTVLLGNANDVFPMMGKLSMDSKEFHKKLMEGKVAFFEENLLGKRNTTLVLSSGSMNILPYQKPLQISSNIRHLMYEDMSGQIMNAGLKLNAKDFHAFLDGIETYVPASLRTERVYNMLGYSLMRHDQYEQAQVLFKKNMENHPESANVYDSYGDGLLAIGKIEEAIPFYEKAIELGTVESHRDLELFRKNLAKTKEMIASQN